MKIKILSWKDYHAYKWQALSLGQWMHECRFKFAVRLHHTLNIQITVVWSGASGTSLEWSHRFDHPCQRVKSLSWSLFPCLPGLVLSREAGNVKLNTTFQTVHACWEGVAMGSSNCVMSSSVAIEAGAIRTVKLGLTIYISLFPKSPIMWIGPFLHTMHGAALLLCARLNCLCCSPALMEMPGLPWERKKERKRERERERERERAREQEKSIEGKKIQQLPNETVMVSRVWKYQIDYLTYFNCFCSHTASCVCKVVSVCVFAWDKQWETWKSTPHSPINEWSSYSVTTPCCDQLSCWTVLRALLMFKWPRTWNISIDPGSSDLCVR